MLADSFIQFCMSVYFLFHMYSDKIKGCFIKLCCYLPCIDTIHTFIFQMPKMYDFHCSNAKYMNPHERPFLLNYHTNVILKVVV